MSATTNSNPNPGSVNGYALRAIRRINVPSGMDQVVVNVGAEQVQVTVVKPEEDAATDEQNIEDLLNEE